MIEREQDTSIQSSAIVGDIGRGETHMCAGGEVMERGVASSQEACVDTSR